MRHDRTAGQALTPDQAAGGLTGVVRAVVTTGIHCRDGCPARPLPANIRLFPTRALAEAAGYRACKRCGGGPDGPEISQRPTSP